MADPSRGGVAQGPEFPASQDDDPRPRRMSWEGPDGALQPPFPPDWLYHVYTRSPYLRPNVDAFAVNVDGLGHRFEPVVNLDDRDAAETIRGILDFEKWLERGGDPLDAMDEELAVTDEEVEAAIRRLRVAMVRQQHFLDRWFSTAAMDASFIAMRRATRVDQEVYGNGYWEVIRDARGRIAYFKRIKARTVMLLPRDLEPTWATRVVRRSVFRCERLRYAARFRRFVQVVGNHRRYFREFGDPRTVSSRTGKLYRSVRAMRAEEPGAVAANEVIHFRIEDAASDYGVPRWINALAGLLSSQKVEEVNYDYFDNKGIPPLAAYVNGGRFSKTSADALRDLIRSHKGSKKFWDVLILEAEPGVGPSMEATGRTEIKLEPLMDAQPSDGVFQKLDERGGDKAASTFRLGRIFRGDDTRVQNRATAETSLRIAEGQVFGPERDEFDAFINDFVLPEFGISAWMMRSRGPSTTGAAEKGELATRAYEKRGIDRNEYREVLEPALGVRLPRETDSEEK